MWITATTTTKVTQKEYDDDDNNNKQQKKKKNKKKKNYDEETLTEPKWTSWVIMRFAICVCVIITIYYFNKNIHIKYINDVYTSHITFGRLCTVFWCSWLLCCSVRFFSLHSSSSSSSSSYFGSSCCVRIFYSPVFVFTLATSYVLAALSLFLLLAICVLDRPLYLYVFIISERKRDEKVHWLKWERSMTERCVYRIEIWKCIFSGFKWWILVCVAQRTSRHTHTHRVLVIWRQNNKI